PSVARLRELAAVAVREVVHEAVGVLEPERFELALVAHGARPVALVREQVRTLAEAPLDDEDLGFLAGLETAEVAFVVFDLVGDQPLGRAAHGCLLRFGADVHESPPPGRVAPARQAPLRRPGQSPGIARAMEADGRSRRVMRRRARGGG